jgi:hypothetical protein
MLLVYSINIINYHILKYIKTKNIITNTCIFRLHDLYSSGPYVNCLLVLRAGTIRVSVEER